MKSQHLTYYSEDYQGVVLHDLERLTRHQLLKLNADVVSQLISLNNQIQEAVSSFRETGRASDHDWFRRIRSRRSMVACFYAHLAVALAKSKAQDNQRNVMSHEIRGGTRRLSPHLQDLQSQAQAGIARSQQRRGERMGRQISVVRRVSGR